MNVSEKKKSRGDGIKFFSNFLKTKNYILNKNKLKGALNNITIEGPKTKKKVLLRNRDLNKMTFFNILKEGFILEANECKKLLYENIYIYVNTFNVEGKKFFFLYNLTNVNRDTIVKSLPKNTLFGGENQFIEKEVILLDPAFAKIVLLNRGNYEVSSLKGLIKFLHQ